jgi:uncharacterized GH25 family protein
MRFRVLLAAAFIAGLTSALAAHDLFLKLADFRVAANGNVLLTAFNGTFTKSENAIARSRVADLSIVGPAGREHLDTTHLSAAGTRTLIKAKVGAAGTYLAGLSIKPSQISLKGAQFNDYLKEEGLGQVLEARRKAGELDAPSTERYAKHVKAIFRAGSTGSGAWSTVLGYPVEIVPSRDPNDLAPGDTLRVRVLVNGAAAPAGQEVLAGGRRAGGAPIPEQQLRADAAGNVSVRIGSAGAWYVKFISMTKVNEPGVNYVSQWATLTFAVAPPTGKAP